MKKKYRITAGILFILGAVLTGCGGKERGTAYAEEQGIVFTSEREFSLPAVAYFNDSDGNKNIDMSEQGLAISCSGANYEFDEVSVSGPDEKGNVEMHIVYTVSAENTITQDASRQYGGKILSDTGWRTIGMFDYYTGYTIPEKYESGDGSVEGSVEFNDCMLEYTLSRQSVSVWGDWKNPEGDIWELQGMTACTYRYTVTMPANYDGLCLYLCLSGRPEYADFENGGQSVSRPVLENLEKD